MSSPIITASVAIKHLKQAAHKNNSLSSLKTIAQNIHKKQPDHFLYHTLQSCFYGVPSHNQFKEAFLMRCQTTLQELKTTDDHLIGYAKKIIKKNSSIATQGCTPLVLSTFLHTTIPFTIHVTEAQPSNTGIDLVQALPNKKIHYYLDASAATMLEQADVLFLEGKAASSHGYVVVAPGGHTLALLAQHLHVPVYVLMRGMHFDPYLRWEVSTNEQKAFYKEIWAKPPKKLQHGTTPFDIIAPEHVHQFITELGAYDPKVLHETLSKTHPWIFSELL